MYAIIRTGGKQYRVQPGDVIRVEKLEQNLGSEFDVTDVLFVGGETLVSGAPIVPNAKVTFVVTKQTKEPKVIIFKKKRRQGYRRFATHRQPFTELFVKAISLNGSVKKADGQANVIDVEQRRKDREQGRIDTKQAARTGPREGAAQAKAAPKKAAAKKAAPKKKVAKKATGKKAAAKKSAKKTSKKA